MYHKEVNKIKVFSGNGASVGYRTAQGRPHRRHSPARSKIRTGPVSLLADNVLAFFIFSGELKTLTQRLARSDMAIVRVLEGLVNLLIEKKRILFTELPPDAQEEIRVRQ
ncbi:MAG: hypothetical protein JZU50_13235 [Desulfobulbaceae bacterium]|nr:hypothetical protein [Desulfobulbaceae bacterium]